MKRDYQVFGMTCSACAAHVENAVKRVKGVSDVTVSLLTNSMVVEYDDPADDGAICLAVKRAGYRASLLPSGEGPSFPEPGRETSPLYRLILSVVLSLILFWLAMGHMIGIPIPPFLHPHAHPYVFMGVQLVLAYSVAFINYRYFTGGFLALLRRAPNMDSLVMLGSGASLLHGTVSFILALIGGRERAVDLSMELYLDAAAMILALVTLGKTLEGRAKHKTTAAIRALAALSPDRATVLRDGEAVEIPVSALAVGDILILKTGDRVAADGTVVSGTGCCDESSLTGESRPIDKAEGPH